MDIQQLARHIFTLAKENTYEQLLKKYEYFVKPFPIVTKYMCHGFYHDELFKELLQEKNNNKLKFEENFVLQTNYVKKLLIAAGYSKIEAKKVANHELAEIEIQINQIKKQEKQIKQTQEIRKKENADDLLKEFTDFVMNIEPQTESAFKIIKPEEWTPESNLKICMVEINGEFVPFDSEVDINLVTALMCAEVNEPDLNF